MPQPIVFQDPSGWGAAFGNLGGALGKVLGDRRQQQKQSQGLDAFQKALKDSGGDTEKIGSALAAAMKANVDPRYINALNQQYQQSRSDSAFQTALDAANKLGGIDTPKGKYEFLSKYTSSGGDLKTALGMFQSGKTTQSVFDKKIDEYKADAIIEYMDGGNDSSANLKNNLEFLQANLQDVGMRSGITERGIFKSELFTEYENRGNLVLDGVIKVFNKAGVLPQKKLEWIRNTFAISPYDTQKVIQGKINALSSLARDTEEFNNDMALMIDKYGADIPTSEFIRARNKLNNKVKNFEKENLAAIGAKFVDKLPAKSDDGDIATNDETGESFIYNAKTKKWVKQR